MKIGIQGIRGSYHDKVAKCYFGDHVSVQEFLSFDDLAISVSNNDLDFGLWQ
jgi:prephenate dehydratase